MSVYGVPGALFGRRPSLVIRLDTLQGVSC